MVTHMQIFPGRFFQSFQNKHKQYFQKPVVAFLPLFLLQMSRFKGEANFSFATIFDATISVIFPLKKLQYVI